MKIRVPALIAFYLFFFASAVAFGQEQLGAGRMELSGAPGGGILFTKPATTTDIDFSNYALGGGFTYNLTRVLGLEGEIGNGLGVQTTFTRTITQAVVDENGNVTLTESTLVRRSLSPRTLAYEGNLVLHPRGTDHTLVPYVTGGIGGLTMFTRTELKDFGLVNDTTYLTANTGAGLKWFVAPGWGLRADYRFLLIKSRKSAPEFFGLNENRYGHRVYGSFVYTFGK